MDRHSLRALVVTLSAVTSLFSLAACEEEEVKQLPCAVQEVLARNCQGCHQKPVKYGAPMPLTSYADLHAQAGLLDRIHARVNDSDAPMPPSPNPPLSAADRQVLEDWIAAKGPAATMSEQCAPGEEPTAQSVYSSPDTPPSDCKGFYEFRAHGDTLEQPYELPREVSMEGNRYMCFFFKTPWGAKDKALWLHSLVDNSKVLHHWILYGNDNLNAQDGTARPCSAVQAGSYFIAGWAPGGGDFLLPSNVEMDLPSGPNSGLILEVHYFKNDAEAATDNSGVKVCTAPGGTREQVAGVTFTGGEGICIPPNDGQVVSGMCDPRDDRGDVHIIGAWPHMHKLGRRMKITVLRSDGREETMLDEPFDFASQIYYPFPQDKWVLHPGDKMRTECFFENDSDRRIPFGERTQDEMCYGFITSWPAGALENAPSLVESVGGVAQQKRRCLDPLSILNSCNGIADYPLPTN